MLCHSSCFFVRLTSCWPPLFDQNQHLYGLLLVARLLLALLLQELGARSPQERDKQPQFSYCTYLEPSRRNSLRVFSTFLSTTFCFVGPTTHQTSPVVRLRTN